jgi:mRNA-degrading endonuclease RelE of RelBE toxin-antitoxin system
MKFGQKSRNWSARVSYQIEYSQEVRLDLRKMPARFRNRARTMIEALSSEPRPARSKELRDLPGLHRLRLEQWRIIYSVDDNEARVLILRIKRKAGPETYKDLGNP